MLVYIHFVLEGFVAKANTLRSIDKPEQKGRVMIILGRRVGHSTCTVTSESTPTVAVGAKMVELGSIFHRKTTTGSKVIEFHVGNRMVHTTERGRVANGTLHTILERQMCTASAANTNLSNVDTILSTRRGRSNVILVGYEERNMSTNEAVKWVEVLSIAWRCQQGISANDPGSGM